MGLFESAKNTIPIPPVGQFLDSLNKFNPFRTNVRPQVIDKFSFIIFEREKPSVEVVLSNDFLPMEMIPFGGRQKVVKDYYPGNFEPSLHVMGPEENDISIKGRFKDKRLSNAGSSQAVIEQLEGIRIRGSLLEISWGTFRRFAVLKETKFELVTTKDINYTLTFDIFGFIAPSGCKVIGRNDIPFEVNTELKNLNAAFRDSPFESDDLLIEKNIFDELNDLISAVAESVSIVTNYVDSVVSLAENAVRTVNRAIGVINNAVANINRFQTRLRALSFLQISKFPTLAGLQSRPTRITFNSIRSLNVKKVESRNLQLILAQLKDNIAKIQQTLPLRRHLVQDGDTLQKLSFRFYDDSSLWTKIKEHNGLTDTTLVAGQVIEIPRI